MFVQGVKTECFARNGNQVQESEIPTVRQVDVSAPLDTNAFDFASYRKREPVHYGRLVINLVNGLRHTDCLCILLKIVTIKPETEFKCWYDTPTRIHTDQRLEFKSRLFFNYAAY